jgi:phosphopentomutase
LTYFDERLPELLDKLREEDILMITADHGCDPSTPSTDHSREYTPLVLAGKKVPVGKSFGTKDCFADIAATILHYFGIEQECEGTALPL